MADNETWTLRDLPYVDLDIAIKEHGVSIKDMAYTYAATSIIAAGAPELLTMDQWTMMGAFSKDRRVTSTAAEILTANNFIASEFLGESPLFDFVAYKRGEGTSFNDRMLALSVGRANKPFLAGNPWAEFAMDTATLWLGVGIAAKVGKVAISAAAKRIGIAAAVEGSLTGSVIAATITGGKAVAGSPVGSLVRFLNRHRIGTATVGLGMGAALGVEDVVRAATADPNFQIDTTKRSIAESNFQRMGGRIDYGLNAAGEEGGLLDNKTYTDAEGNIVSEEEMLRLGGGRNTSQTEVEPSGLTPGITAAQDGPDSPILSGTGRPSPNAPVDIMAPGLGGGVFDPSELAKQPASTLRAMRDNDELSEAQFQQVMTAREAYEQSQLNELRNKEYQANPHVAVSQNYWRSQYGNEEAMNREADELKSKGVPYTVVQSYRRAGRPLYHVLDVEATVADMGALKLLAFQEQAIAAGLIDPESTEGNRAFRLGLLDERTFEAMGVLQGLANMEGDRTTWQEMLDHLEQVYEPPSDDRKPWVPPRAYFTPDYARISQGIDEIFSQQLGRDPNGWEAELLADEYRKSHRAAFDQEMAASQFLYDAEGRAMEDDVAIKPPTFEEIDPWSRAMESFDSQFSNEIDAKQRWADVRSKTSNLFGSLDTISRA